MLPRLEPRGRRPLNSQILRGFGRLGLGFSADSPKDLFNRIDANNDGVVSREEFEMAMQMQAWRLVES